MKNIVLFIDGTGNDGIHSDPEETTNVFKLHTLCEEPPDLNLYVPGVGTDTMDIFGGAAGAGTKDRLREAYDFLTTNYQQGDHIFLFGFSRGAMAARLFAGFLGEVGLLFATSILNGYLPHVYKLYEGAVMLGAMTQFRNHLRRYYSDDRPVDPLPIHFLGVWDTVEEYFGYQLPNIEVLPSHITYARHALALHERRHEMEPTLWTKWDAAQSNVAQVWFPGAHADVGGGYREPGLARAPLQWMRDEAVGCGLRAQKTQLSAEPLILHQERTGGRKIGWVVSRIRGEGPREALALSQQGQARDSLDIAATARDQLLHPIRQIQFTGADDQRARKELKSIDETTFRVLLSLRAGDAGSLWQAERTLDDLASVDAKINLFLDSPHGLSKDTLSTPLALLVIVTGDTTSVSRRLDALSDSLVDVVHDALEEFRSTLQGWRVQIPEPLSASIGRVADRAAAQDAKRRAAQAEEFQKFRQRAKPVKLIPKAGDDEPKKPH